MQTIEETTRYCLGDKSTRIIFNYLKKRGIAKQDIPKKLNVFALELDNVLGPREGGKVTQNLKKAYIAVFCMKLKINYVESSSDFSAQIRKIKETYVKSQFK